MEAGGVDYEKENKNIVKIANVKQAKPAVPDGLAGILLRQFHRYFDF